MVASTDWAHETSVAAIKGTSTKMVQQLQVLKVDQWTLIVFCLSACSHIVMRKYCNLYSQQQKITFG